MRTRRLAWFAFIGAICALLTFGVLRWRKADTVTRTAAGTEGSESPAAKEAANAAYTETATTSGVVVRRGVLAGRVTDDGGRPIAGAEVCSRAYSEKLVTADMQTPFCATTSADGKYRLDGLPTARYSVNAAAPSYEPLRYQDPKQEGSLYLKAGEVRDNVDFVLARGGVEVRGRVKDIAGGVVANALVTVVSGEPWAPHGTSVTKSNAQGEFTAWTAKGRVSASAIASGYTTGKKNGIAPGQRIEILLTPESVLQGRVLEAGTETPIMGARVTAGALTSEMDFGNEDRSTLTDVDGRFRIAGLDPGRYKPTAQSARHWGSAGESVLLGLAESSREVVIEMHAALTVVGRVELPGKKPCEGGTVGLKETKTQERRWGEGDGDGRVRIEGLFPGTYHVEVWCSHAARKDKYPAITVADKDITGIVWPVDTGFTVSGIVVDAGGKPIRGASLQARTKGGDPRSQMGWAQTEAGRDGTFSLKGLLAANYAIHVHREGAVTLKDPFEVNVDRDLENVRIALAAGGAIEGTVTDGSGTPVGGLDIRAKGERWDWQSGRTTSKDDGTFSFPAMNPGDYHVVAEQNWNAVKAPGTKDDDVQGSTATVRVGEIAHVKLTVESRNGEIRGRVVDETGVPLSDAFVDAERESDAAGVAKGEARRNMHWAWGDVRSPVLTDVDGNFTVTKLSAGSYTLRAFRKGGGETVAEGVKVGASVTLKIRTEGSITGTLADAKGAAPERFAISIRDEKSGINRRETFFRTNGAWTMRDLPEGDYHVSAEAAGRALAQVKLAQGERRDGVRLVIAANASVRGRIVSLETGEPVPGMLVFARSAKGDDNNMFMIDESEDRKNISDADGRFEVEHAPAGRVTITMFAKDWDNAAYAGGAVATTIEAGITNEVKPIKVARARVKGDLTGDLGFHTQDAEPGADLDSTRHVVSAVRPNSPAAKAGIVVGDEIVSVDGYDVVGPNGYLYGALSRVPEGTAIKLGLRSGNSVVVRAARPQAPGK